MNRDESEHKSFSLRFPANVAAAVTKAAAVHLYSQSAYCRAAVLDKLRAEGIKFDDHPATT
jgi:hypothetical protein